MSKKWWLLIILFIIVVGWLIASKYSEGVDPWLGENVGGPIAAGLVSTKNSIVSSSAWQMYIGPYVYIYTFIGGLIVMFFGYRWVTQKQLPFQNPKVPVEQPMSTVVPQQTYVPPTPTSAVSSTPIVTPGPAPVVEEPKKEEEPVVA